MYRRLLAVAIGPAVAASSIAMSAISSAETHSARAAVAAHHVNAPVVPLKKKKKKRGEYRAGFNAGWADGSECPGQSFAHKKVAGGAWGEGYSTGFQAAFSHFCE
jgi:hypothetical protein